MAEAHRDLPGVSNKGTNALGLCPHDHVTSQRPYFLTTSPSGVRISTWILGAYKHSVHCTSHCPVRGQTRLSGLLLKWGSDLLPSRERTSLQKCLLQMWTPSPPLTGWVTLGYSLYSQASVSSCVKWVWGSIIQGTNLCGHHSLQPFGMYYSHTDYRLRQHSLLSMCYVEVPPKLPSPSYKVSHQILPCNTVRSALWLSPFYRWGNRGPNSPSDHIAERRLNTILNLSGWPQNLHS